MFIFFKNVSLIKESLLCLLCFFIFQDDKTRVAIGDNQDYINASYIRMLVGDEEHLYISCQGPLPSTVTAFWQMIWENKSDVIAMMTQEVERGRVKCHKYWPERLGTPQDAGGYQLHLENQQFLEYFHIKVIRMVEKQVRDEESQHQTAVVTSLSNSAFFFQSGDTHSVHHLKFTHWPDHGVPHSSDQLVRFIRYMRSVHGSGPVTVHCSAGIGRAGVLICTDVILGLIDNDLPVSKSRRPGGRQAARRHNVDAGNGRRRKSHTLTRCRPAERCFIEASPPSAD